MIEETMNTLLNNVGGWTIAIILLIERVTITTKFNTVLERLTILIDERMPKGGI